MSKIRTVLGDIDTKSVGIISPHEHVFADGRIQFTEFCEVTKKILSEQKVNMSNLDVLSRNPYAIKDNLLLEDVKLAEKELLCFKKAGGEAIVDATTIGIGRDPEALKNISQTINLPIIMGSGYYTEDTHPDCLKKKTVNDISKEIINEIKVGINNTNIKVGVIGELGTSDPILPGEKKVLISGAKAQSETGVGIIVHTYPWGRRGLEALDILSNNGADLDKVYISHVDIEIDIDYDKSILEKGAYVGFDCFGKEFFINQKDRDFAGGVFARDIERVKAIKELIDSGYLSKILIACDICLKNLLHTFGGWGYDHILNNIIPMMKEVGITKEQIDTILITNPKKFLEI